MNTHYISTADFPSAAEKICAGDKVYLSGTVYTARDAAHGRIMELIKMGEPLPFDLKGASVYYAGPTPTPEGLAIGSCGPTTSGRMDSFSPHLLDLGLSCMIGKGQRNKAVCEAIVRNKAVIYALSAAQVHWLLNVLHHVRLLPSLTLAVSR